ncbi:hypothetical protein QIA31_05565 (plasmid) [Borreliella turdi]
MANDLSKKHCQNELAYKDL